MNVFELIPAFSWREHVIEPWATMGGTHIWTVLMGFFVTAACGLVGNYLILRRMALVGDAISHSVLPGLAVAFLLTESRGSLAMFLGALMAGILTTVIIEVIHRKTRVKQDAAIGIAFTSLFALGVLLISWKASAVDLDQECVLYGEISFVSIEPFVEIGGREIGPPSVVRMAVIAVCTAILIGLFYKELLVSSFDAGLATSLGINAMVVHYVLMGWLSVVVVSAFRSVGAILVIAMLILPGATGSLLSRRMPVIFGLTILHAALSAITGLHLALWLNCSTAGAMVVMACFYFVLAWMFGPEQGLLSRWIQRRKAPAPEDADPALNEAAPATE